MRENKLVISAPGVSLSHKAAKSKAIPTQRGQLKFHIAKKQEARRQKCQKSSVKSLNALAEFGWVIHWQGQIAGRVKNATGDSWEFGYHICMCPR